MRLQTACPCIRLEFRKNLCRILKVSKESSCIFIRLRVWTPPSPLISYFVVMIMELLASWVLLLSFVPTSHRRSDSGLLNNHFFNSIWYPLEAKMKNDGFNHVNAWRTQLLREEPVTKRTSARWFGVVIVLQLRVCVENNVSYLEPFNDRQHLWEDNVPGVALNTNHTDSVPKSGLEMSKYLEETVSEQGQLQLRTLFS